MLRKHIKQLLACFIAAVLLLPCIAAGAEEEPAIDEIKRSLTFSSLTAQPITEVTENFILPVSYKGAFIVWQSDNENAVCIDGGSADLWARVIRPPFGEGYVSATLTAHIIKDDEMVEKSFLIRVKEQDIGFTYSETVKEAYRQFEMEFLSKQDIFSLKGDLVLPDARSYDSVSVSYKSDTPSVITDDGKVTRNYDNDTVVTFTVFFTEGFESFKVSYPITVKAYTDDELLDIAEKDLDSVISRIEYENNLMSLMSDVSLSTIGSGGSSITWVSGDSSVISDSGEINSSASGKSTVLTVWATFNGASTEQRELTVQIAGNTGSISEIKGNPGLGGGGGGGSSSKPAQKEEENENKDEEENKVLAFTDVPDTHWAKNEISFLAEKGIINGVGENLFAPQSLVTREQAVKIIMLAMKFNVDSNEKTSAFTDVSDNAWYTPYIASAYKGEIVNGVSENKFGIGRSVTRQELAVLLHRAAEKAGVTLSGEKVTEFKDSAELAAYAKDSVTALAAAGIINGRDGSFLPENGATRAELAAMIYRILQLS